MIDDEKIIQKKQRQAEKCLAKIEKLGTEIKKYMEDVSFFSAKEAIKIERVRPALYELNKDVTNLICDEEALFLTSKEAEEYTGEVAFSIKGFFEKDRYGTSRALSRTRLNDSLSCHRKRRNGG